MLETQILRRVGFNKIALLTQTCALMDQMCETWNDSYVAGNPFGVS
jgi:hypothetical protein